MDKPAPKTKIPKRIPQDVTEEDKTEEGRVKRAWDLFRASIEMPHPLKMDTRFLLEISKHFKIRLYDYQRDGVQRRFRMWDVMKYGGSYLADKMGLGKTVQTIALLARIKLSGALGPHPIIVPPQLVPQWVTGIDDSVDDGYFRVLVYRGEGRLVTVGLGKRHIPQSEMEDHDIVITTYPLFQGPWSKTLTFHGRSLNSCFFSNHDILLFSSTTVNDCAGLKDSGVRHTYQNLSIHAVSKITGCIGLNVCSTLIIFLFDSSHKPLHKNDDRSCFGHFLQALEDTISIRCTVHVCKLV